MGWLGNILGGVAKSLPGIGQAVSIGSGVLGAISGAKKGAKADKQSQQALDMATGRNAELAPLRSKALQLALQGQPQRENLDAIFADPGNPYARVLPRNTATPTAPLGLPPQAAPGIAPAPMGMGDDQGWGRFGKARSGILGRALR